MDDIAAAAKESAVGTAFGSEPRLDLQSHIADLEAQGLLVRIDHPVNKDTELHPLVRLQFIGGIPEAERRAFLFTNVTDATGRRRIGSGESWMSPGRYELHEANRRNLASAPPRCIGECLSATAVRGAFG